MSYLPLKVITPKNIFPKRDRKYLFSGGQLTKEAMYACEQLFISQDGLKPRKLEDFYNKGIPEKIQQIRYDHFENKRQQKMAIIKDFIVKERMKQRSFTQELNATSNISRVKADDNPYVNSSPAKPFRSKKNTPKSRAQPLNVQKEVLSNPVTSKESIEKDDKDKKNEKRNFEEKNKLELRKERFTYFSERRKKKIEEIFKNRIKYKHDLIKKSSLMSKQIKTFFLNLSEKERKMNSSMQEFSKKRAEEQLHKMRLQSNSENNEKRMVYEKLKRICEKMENTEKNYHCNLMEKQERIMIKNHILDERKKIALMQKNQDQEELIKYNLEKLYKKKLDQDKKKNELFEQSKFLKDSNSKRFEKFQQNRKELMSEENKKIKILESNYKNLGKIISKREHILLEYSQIKREVAKLKKEDQEENLKREMMILNNQRAETAFKIKDKMRRTKKITKSIKFERV